VLRPVMAKVVNGAPVAPGSDVDTRVSAEESGLLEVDPRCPARGPVSVRAGSSPLGAATGDDEPNDNGERAQDRHDPQARPPWSSRARGVAEPPPPEEKIERRVQRTDAQSDRSPAARKSQPAQRLL